MPEKLPANEGVETSGLLAEKPAVTELQQQTKKQVSETGKRRLFADQTEARAYMAQHVIPEEEKKEVDISPLRDLLFQVPDSPTPQKYEFENGKGLRVSYEVVSAKDQFSWVWKSLRFVESQLEGTFHPILQVKNIDVQAPGFRFRSEELEQDLQIIWLPNLKSTRTEHLSFLSHLESGRKIVLLGDDGWLSRPKDFLTLFHELGHSETRTDSEHREERRVNDKVIGAGLQLQRENDANQWMRDNTSFLEGQGVSRELIEDYVLYVQMRGYHDAFRPLLKTGV